MKNRILHLKPVAYSDLNDTILEYLNQYKADNTTIEIRNLKKGPSHLEYLYYQSVAEVEIIDEIIRAEEEGFVAAIISCFDDPGLYVSREISKDIIITAP
ncbi:MAG TPA: hydantoin racemase, partial [Clostridiaceae bacterium]|nr:hydantoin racemase [Clostridiaceae bacterium]